MRANLFRSLSTLFVSVSAAILFSSPAAAAGNYSQNFSTTPTNWTNVNDTFAVVSGSYNTQSTANQPERAIAVYSGTTWGTNYTYSAKLNSDFESDGNRVGIIFSYTDPSNFYDMSVSMRKNAPGTSQADIDASGHATLNRWVGGVKQVIADFHPAPGAAWPSRDTFFTATVIRNGTSTVLQVNGTTVITRSDVATTTGKVGFFAQFNNGRFDDVSVVDNSSSSTLLFRSGFNPPVTLSSPICHGSWFMDITGMDASGFAWTGPVPPNPPTMPWGGPKTEMFNVAVPCNDNDPNHTFEKNLDIQLKLLAGPTGANTKVLSNTVKVWHPDYEKGLSPRAGVTYYANGPVPERYYIRRFLRYPADLLSRLGENTWFTQHEYKTGCTGSAPGDTQIPGRIAIDFANDHGAAYYHLRADDQNNCDPAKGPVWEAPHCNFGAAGCPAPPAGVWFYDEFEVYAPQNPSTPGFIRYAVSPNTTGPATVIFNVTTNASQPLPAIPTRVKFTPGYSNVPGLETQVDDLEVHSAAPCGSFPCGPPTHVPD